MIDKFIALTAEGVLAIALGYFVGAAYYRMNKITKVLVSVFVPTVCFVVIPLVLLITESAIPLIVSNVLAPIYRWIESPYYALTATYLTTAVVCLTFVWLLTRRAPAKPTII